MGNSSTCSSLLLWSAVLLWLWPSLRLRLMPIPLCSMELTELMELMAMASPMPDMAMVPTPMLTTERGLLTPSPRLMLLFSTELTDMVDMVLVMPDTAMEPTPMPMERGLLMLSLRLMLMLTTMELMVLAMPDTAMLLPTPMVPTPMPTDMASKKSSNSNNQSRPPSTNAEAQKQTKS